jgi:membrane protein insertase Oxa1/YidC/SpoIIIJ
MHWPCGKDLLTYVQVFLQFSIYQFLSSTNNIKQNIFIVISTNDE